MRRGRRLATDFASPRQTCDLRYVFAKTVWHNCRRFGVDYVRSRTRWVADETDPLD